MLRKAISVAVCLVLVGATTAVSQQRFALRVKAAPAKKGQFYLASELQAAVAASADVVGFNKGGDVVVRCKSADKLHQAPPVRSVSKVGKEKLAKVQLLIGYQQGHKDDVEASLKRSGYKIVKQSERSRYFVVESAAQNGAGILAPRMVKALVTDVARSGGTSATPNYRLRVPEKNLRRRAVRRPGARNTTAPSDPFFGDLWGLENINAPTAWQSVTTSPAIVAVIDTGTQIEHADLQDNIWVNEAELNGVPGQDDDNNGFVDDVNGWDFFNGDNSVFDGNHDDHGTHVAGTIGAVQDTFGVVGVNFRIQIMPVKFLGANGGSTADAIDAINYAVDNGATILNNSWGGGGFSPLLLAAIENANAEGVLFVAAAGNATNDNDAIPSFPASYEVDNVVAVASIDEPVSAGGEQLSFFSSFGATSVDIAAPGGDVLSTVPDNAHEFFSGTSMATPHVSGALALMRGSATYSTMPHLDLRQTLLDNARPAAQLVGKCVTGGTLDIDFLGGPTPPKPPSGASIAMATTSFEPGDVSVGPNNNLIASVEIELQTTSQILVTGNSAAQTLEPGTVLDMGLQANVTGDEFRDALRFISFPDAETWTGTTITHGAILPPGKYTIEWVGFPEGGTVDFDGGSLSVIAIGQNGAPAPDMIAARKRINARTAAGRNLQQRNLQKLNLRRQRWDGRSGAPVTSIGRVRRGPVERMPRIRD